MTTYNFGRRGLTINTQTVDVELLNESLDPCGVCSNNRRVLGVDIGQGHLGVAKPAVLFTGRVAPLDGAVRVVLRLLRRSFDLNFCHGWKVAGRTLSWNMYVDRSGSVSKAMTLFTTTSTMRNLLVRQLRVRYEWNYAHTFREHAARPRAPSGHQRFQSES